MKLAIFDFDGTLLTKDTLPCLGKEWIRQKRSLNRYALVYLYIIPTLVWYNMRIISRENFKNLVFDRFNLIFKRMSRTQINEFFQNAYPNIKEHSCNT